MFNTFFVAANVPAPADRAARRALIESFNNTIYGGPIGRFPALTGGGFREGLGFRATVAAARGVAEGGLDVRHISGDTYVATAP